MICPKCRDIVDRRDIPHVIKKCEACGRIMYVHESGKYGMGIKIRKGDTFVIPEGWIKLSPHPLKGTFTFTKQGLHWFAEKVFIQDLPSKNDQILEELKNIEDSCDDFLKKSPLLKGMDIENHEHSEKIINLLKENKETIEWWTFLTGIFISSVRDALEKNDIKQAIWGMACAERCRALSKYKENYEEVVWMGHSAKRIVDILNIWDGNKANNEEGFWQRIFSENSYVISQIFAVPMIFIQDKAYVGGMNIDRKDAKFVDYLFSMESSREAILVEIKTPVTKLLASKYRGVYRPSAELTGSISQVLDYRAELSKNLRSITEGTQYDISLFNPRCVIIIGNGELELKEETQRKSFELFRTCLKDVEIVTYDELFRKVDILASLFNLIRKK
jgi:hypothetical protein